MIAIFNAIPKQRTSQTVIPNESITLWLYDVDQVALQQAINDIVNRHLETSTEQTPPGWWFSQYDEQSWRAGAFSENNNVDMLLAATALLVLSNEMLLAQPFYMTGLTSEIQLSYTAIKGLSQTASRQVYQVIVDGVRGNLSPVEIRKNIIKRFSVAVSSANRIVDTEINRINNTARTEVVRMYRDQFGYNVAVRHISALMATTRHNHAARHRKIYTPEQQNRWWDQGSNRINCHCSVRSVVLEDTE